MWTLYRVPAELKVPLADLLPDAVPPTEVRPGQLIYGPGCDLAERSILKTYERDQPCPSCGLPAGMIQQVLAARRRAVGPYE